MPPSFKASCCSRKKFLVGGEGTGHVMCRSGKQLLCGDCETLLEAAGEIVDARGQAGDLQLWLNQANAEDEHSQKIWNAEGKETPGLVQPQQPGLVQQKVKELLHKGTTSGPAPEAAPVVVAKRPRLPTTPIARQKK